MMLMEQTQMATAALPVAEFRDHMRLGTGFDDDGVQDGGLETFLRAAIAAVEGRTGKVLISRDFLYTLRAWRDLGAQVLPVAPVTAINSFVIVDRTGAETTIDAAKYMLEQDMQRPRLVSTGFVLPQIPVAGEARIAFTAGFASRWSDLPADLAQAVFLLAAHYYEHRHETAVGEALMPFGVRTLLERYRTLRLFGGRN
ncbi:head-tail connector protein [Celeribacter halophilus]|uniref:Head-tail connector protein n=1 Tax=Celeribacter halophilus TaxID=576117 RepID=A0AAW7XXR5_9RHOB|nr:head-tail connector protein [Celeribacter halophilus]MDO6458840.1 head-tail connector protein [Celeribacter halophilus]MDO6722675.1 head-tail connector protein [Celeribacter halophilus]